MWTAFKFFSLYDYTPRTMAPWSYHRVDNVFKDEEKTTMPEEGKTLLQDGCSEDTTRAETRACRLPIVFSSILNVVLLFLLLVSVTRYRMRDPTLQIWCEYLDNSPTLLTR